MCNFGAMVGQGGRSLLGEMKEGVYLSKHADLCLERAALHRFPSPVHVIMYKVCRTLFSLNRCSILTHTHVHILELHSPLTNSSGSSIRAGELSSS